MQINEFFRKIISSGGSDLFVCGGKAPYARMSGELIPLDTAVVPPDAVDEFRKSVLPQESEKSYHIVGSYDAAYCFEKGRRFRINFLVQQGTPAFVARPLALASSLDFKALGLPDEIENFGKFRRGLILISGSAGSGKTTTMACIVNYINSHYKRHIVTLEDPIEFVHEDNMSLLTQRETGSDTANFAEALKNVVRQSPDVIVIGEMRDFESMQTAITAALTGHLVISTVHTADSVQTVERIINHFPEHLREQAASDLSIALNGIIAQRLLPRKNGGLVPAVEIMKATPLIKNLIALKSFSDLEEAIKRGYEEGMRNFTRAACDLYKDGLITLKTGMEYSGSQEEFLLLAEGMETGVDTFREDLKNNSGVNLEINMKCLLHSAIVNGASDLILSCGHPPCLRVDGELRPLDTEPLTPGDTKKLLFSIINQRQRAAFEETRELDFAMSANDDEGKSRNNEARRFRINAFYQKGSIGIAVRIISSKILSPEVLGLPPVIVKMTDKMHGLILITGPTGHGKSTTLASLIDRINSTRYCHIVTIEDPIEYVHPNKQAVVEQREVHADTLSFSSALKYVLRQDPDVILIGEMRDTETISAALTAAETGHLVLATLHTNDAVQSIDRIIDSFPAHQQNQIRMQLAGTLLGIVSQRLLPRKNDSGRVAAFEILVGIPGVKALIRDGKTHMMQSLMETQAKEGMVTMEKALKELYAKGIISMDEVRSLINIQDTREDY